MTPPRGFAVINKSTTINTSGTYLVAAGFRTIAVVAHPGNAGTNGGGGGGGGGGGFNPPYCYLTQPGNSGGPCAPGNPATGNYFAGSGVCPTHGPFGYGGPAGRAGTGATPGNPSTFKCAGSTTYNRSSSTITPRKLITVTIGNGGSAGNPGNPGTPGCPGSTCYGANPYLSAPGGRGQPGNPGQSGTPGSVVICLS